MTTDQDTFDAKTASPQVQALVAALIFVYVNGGKALPEAVRDTVKHLSVLHCNENYIASALETARIEGEKGWRQKHGLL